MTEKPNVRDVGWDEVMEQVRAILPDPGSKVYGVPRGGAVVAGLMKALRPSLSLVGLPLLADVIVDDVLNTGATSTEVQEEVKGEIDFRVLFNRPLHNEEQWLRMPWEHVDQVRDLKHTVIRQLQMIGEDPQREGLLDTPRRYLSALQEMCSGLKADPAKPLSKVFNEDHDEIVAVCRMPFVSLCEHHLLPFTGIVNFAYLPQGKVVGLSKIPRFIEILSRRPQVQERLTTQIAEEFMKAVDPLGVMVIVMGRHSCMHLRGSRCPGLMKTSAVRGVFKEKPEARAEALELFKMR